MHGQWDEYHFFGAYCDRPLTLGDLQTDHIQGMEYSSVKSHEGRLAFTGFCHHPPRMLVIVRTEGDTTVMGEGFQEEHVRGMVEAFVEHTPFEADRPYPGYYEEARESFTRFSTAGYGIARKHAERMGMTVKDFWASETYTHFLEEWCDVPPPIALKRVKQRYPVLSSE